MDGEIDATAAAVERAAAEPIVAGPGTGWVFATLTEGLARLRGEARPVPEPVASGDYDRWFRDALPRVPLFARDQVVADVSEAAVGRPDNPPVHVLQTLLAMLEPRAGRWIVSTLSLPYGRAELATGMLRRALGDVDRAVEDLSAAHAAHVAAGTAGLAARSGSALAAALRDRRRAGDLDLIRALD